MARESQSDLSKEGQKAFDQYACALRQVEVLSAVTIRNYLSDLRQFMAWCEGCWQEEHSEPSFTPQRAVPSLLARYRTYLQTTLWLKSSSINRTLMSLKRYFAWAVREQIIQTDPIRTIKFVPKEAAAPPHGRSGSFASTGTDHGP